MALANKHCSCRESALSRIDILRRALYSYTRWMDGIQPGMTPYLSAIVNCCFNRIRPSWLLPLVVTEIRDSRV